KVHENLIVRCRAGINHTRDCKRFPTAKIVQRNPVARRKFKLPGGIAPDDALPIIIARRNPLAINLPSRIEFRKLVEPSAGHHDGNILIARDDIQKRCRSHRIGRLQPLDLIQYCALIHQRWRTRRAQGATARSRRPAARNDQVCAEEAKLVRQLFTHVELEIQESRDYGRATDHGHEGDGKAAAIASEQFPEYTAKHHSPRRMGAGSKRAARRKGISPPANATRAASPRTIGKRMIFGDAGAPKTLAPRKRARPEPKTNPIAPPMSASIKCSVKNSAETEVFVAPVAFIMPISKRLSIIAAAEVAATARAAPTRAASVTIQSSVLT